MRLFITQRADDWYHGKPYMVTDLDEVIKTGERIEFIREEEIKRCSAMENCIKISAEKNGFDRHEAIFSDNIYQTWIFRTLAEAEKFVSERQRLPKQTRSNI